MSELSMWELCKPLLAGLDPVRIENVVDPGTPDVSTILGWIELKNLASLPKRPSTLVTIEHFTPQQRAWLLRRCLSGGVAFLLLRAENNWLLFWGTSAAHHIGNSNFSTLCDVAIAHWDRKPSKKELQECLRQNLYTKR